MATCKDCICYESCLDFAEMIGKNIVESITDGHYQCEFFKDRSRFLELSRGVGDMLELFEEFFELGADALDRLCQENSWADYPDEGIDEQNYRYRELGQIFLKNLQEKNSLKI